MKDFAGSAAATTPASLTAWRPSGSSEWSDLICNSRHHGQITYLVTQPEFCSNLANSLTFDP
jgi:hypothetical protein